jgi:signal transduction histidine kinase
VRGAVAGEQVFAWAVVRVRGHAAARLRVGLPADALRAEVRQVWWGAGLAGLLLALGLLTLPWLTVRRGDVRNAELWEALAAANAGLEARVVERTRDLKAREAELVELSARLVGAQEAERARISRDLHDDLGQTLTAVRLQLTAARAATSEPPVAAAVDLALSAVDEGVEGVRRLAHDLRPPALDALGLGPALRSHAERWAESAGLALTLQVADVEPPPEAAEVLFRVAQEALTNVARHAHGAWVGVTLESADDGWRLVVEDDGRGLSETPRAGLGLVGARERADQAGGYLDLDPREGGGLRLLLWLPRV